MNNITESDIIAWLRNQAASRNVKELEISVYSKGTPFSMSLPVSPGNVVRNYGFGQTIAEAAIDLAKTHRTPAERAAELRAKADAIEKEAAL